METVLESEGEEQVRETWEEEEEEEEDGELMKLEGGLHVSAPQELLLELDQAGELHPESYRVNSPDEIRLLAIADNFQRQYSHLYPDRKPLLLCPINECGVQKFVSMTLRPTPTVYPELFTWEGCASFVADFLSLDPLEPPVDLPRYLFSSSRVLQRQRASCFESASLLCSLLLGAHYDAYCVSGYAVREMCLNDQSLQERPLLGTEVGEQKVMTSQQEHQDNKYTVKPLKELKSRFLMQKEKQEAEAALLQKPKLQESRRSSVSFNSASQPSSSLSLGTVPSRTIGTESEQRPADLLRGLRVHCWVLVLSSSRSVQQNFFIDPLSGKSYSTDHEDFLGIESVWNNLNYYVNMQDCTNGCTGVVFDLEDLQWWEPLLYGATSKAQLIHDVWMRKENKMKDINNDDEEDEQPRVFQMPRSWVNDITISKKDLETRWPGGQKVTRYRKAKLERFAAYLRSDGLVTRLNTYKDLDCTEVVMVTDWYQHRDDHLEVKEVNMADSVTTERFRRGRRFHLLLYRRTDDQREMEFSSARVDHLVRREEAPGEITEIYEGRDDFLYYRHLVFDQHVHFSEPHVDLDERPLQEVVERFHRNRSKPASADVAQRAFLLAQRRIEVTYHSEDHRFIPSKRNFIKPQDSTEKQKAEDFSADMVSSFQVDPSENPPTTSTLCEQLAALMKDEEKVVSQIRASQKEVRDILASRQQEEADVQLHVSQWTTTGAARARRHRQEVERLAAEEQRWLQEKEKDLLAPFLIRLDRAETLSAAEAQQLHQDCLAEYKQNLVEHANLIQERYEKETQELQRKQQWYQRNQLTLTEAQEDQYKTYCSEKTLQIHIAKKRLSMHKEAAPQKYRTLDQKLRRDPRLAPHLLS